jgi:diacylglycerol kinase family enzyme
VRALLVHNPNATTTTTAVTDVITRALSAELKLDVESTKRREHAAYLAAGAVHEGYEVVIALGGDGTANEVLQGVAGTPVKLALIPGGSTNVWARSLGLPNDAVEATSVVLRKLRDGEDRVVNVGRANGRWFGFNVGFGFDAEAVRLVEQRARMKRTVRQATFLYCGLRAQLSGFGRKASEVTVQPDDGEAVGGLRSAVCCNADPFTFLGPRPARLCPEADWDLGLDVTALTSLSTPALLRVVQTALTSGAMHHRRSVRMWHDQTGYTITAAEPLPLQLDGDYIGQTDRVRLESVARALTVVA